MRSDAETFQPLGPKVEKPAPEKPEWVPTGTPGIERNRQGQMRNVTPTPPEPQPYLYIGNWETWGRAIEAIRQGK